MSNNGFFVPDSIIPLSSKNHLPSVSVFGFRSLKEGPRYGGWATGAHIRLQKTCGEILRFDRMLYLCRPHSSVHRMIGFNTPKSASLNPILSHEVFLYNTTPADGAVISTNNSAHRDCILITSNTPVVVMMLSDGRVMAVAIKRDENSCRREELVNVRAIMQDCLGKKQLKPHLLQGMRVAIVLGDEEDQGMIKDFLTSNLGISGRQIKGCATYVPDRDYPFFTPRIRGQELAMNAIVIG